MRSFRSILVDVDSTATVHPALERAARIARACSAGLKIVDVIGAPCEAPTLWREQIERDVAGRVHERLSCLANSLTGVTADVAVLRGHPGAALTHEAIRGNHDLLVRSYVRDVVARGPKPFGPVGRQLFRQCPCPVWAVGPGAVPARPRIVAAVHSTSDDAAELDMNSKVIDLALFIADLEHGSLVLLDTWHPFGERRILSHAAHDDFDAYVRVSEHRTSRQLKALRDAYDGCLAGVRLDLLKGDATTIIPEYVVAHGIDTVVTGTSARAGIARLVFGNTAEGLLKRAPCSVLAVKPDGFVSPVRLEDTA
jgi:universal stress protein E